MDFSTVTGVAVLCFVFMCLFYCSLWLPSYTEEQESGCLGSAAGQYDEGLRHCGMATRHGHTAVESCHSGKEPCGMAAGPCGAALSHTGMDPFPVEEERERQRAGAPTSDKTT